MKFNLLNENKLQIIISSNDLSARNIKKWDLVPHNPNAQILFQEILEHANEACGFEVMRDTQLMVEAYPISGESMIMTITKIGSQAEEHSGPKASPSDADFRHRMGDLSVLWEDRQYAVYEVLDLEDAIELAHALPYPDKIPASLYKGEDGRYFLLIPDVSLLGEHCLGPIIEYSHPTNYSPAFLEEHTRLITEGRALSHLASI